jgi:hypothetical protein
METAVRRILLPALAMALAGLPVAAASGDRHRVTGSQVNVRAEPGLTASILGRIQRDQEVVELAEHEAWVQIALTDGRHGWVHRSLLYELPPAPVPAPVATLPQADRRAVPALPAAPALPSIAAAIEPLPAVAQAEAAPAGAAIRAAMAIDPDSVQAFRGRLDYLNKRALMVAGIALFEDVRPVGGGVIQVSTTDAWSAMPPSGQQSYLNTLLDQWSAAKADGGPAGVVIVDPAGAVLMHKTKQ